MKKEVVCMADWRGAGQGALSGAGTGALAGGAIGGVPGAAIGGAGGALGGGLLGLFGGARKDKMKQVPSLTPEQQQLLQSTIGQLQGGQTGQNYGASQNYLQGLLSGDPGIYDRFKAPFVQNFEQQILPRIAEQFAGMGGPFGQGLGSSGFGQAIGGAGAQLEGNLAGLYANLQNQAAQQSMGQYNNLLGMGLGTQSFQNAYQPGSTGALGAFQGISQGIGSGIGQNIGNRISGPNNQQINGSINGGFSDSDIQLIKQLLQNLGTN